MKKRAGFVALTMMMLSCASVAHAEIIRAFDVTLTLFQDGTYNVEETVLYDFESDFRHGMYRVIPLRATVDDESYYLTISDLTVTDRSGDPHPFSSNRIGDELHIKIGDPDKFITGGQEYVLSYRVAGGVLFFEDRDEVYWNVTPTSEQVLIDRARYRFVVPPELDVSSSTILGHRCFVGTAEESVACDAREIRGELEGRALEFISPRALFPGSAMTVAIAIRKGIVPEPTAADYVRKNALGLIPLFIPIFVLWYMIRLWMREGRDPKRSGVIIAQYEAPNAMTPLEMGTLIDGRADLRDVSAEIVYLAVHGYIKIREVKKTIFGFIPSKDHELVGLEKDRSDLNETDQALLRYLFSFGSHGRVTFSELKDKFHHKLDPLRRSVHDLLHTVREVHTRNHRKVRQKWQNRATTAGSLGFFSLFFLAPVLPLFGVTLGFSLIISAGIMAIIGHHMPSVTFHGASMKDHIEGFKMYLETAEKARLEFHNAPDRIPERFEELLPYAMVLGVEKEWAKNFRDVYDVEPTWYESYSGTHGAHNLARSMGAFSSAATKTVYAAPSSGGSGFSGGGMGGGFSGGGFGGGSVGSW